MTVYPEVQCKLRKSVLDAIPELQDRPPSFDDLTAAKLPYLEAVVQETLRLSRTAGGYSREGESLPTGPDCMRQDCQRDHGAHSYQCYTTRRSSGTSSPKAR